MNHMRMMRWARGLAGTALLAGGAALAALPQIKLEFELAPAPQILNIEPALTLERLLAQAAEQHPELAVARARVETARGRMIQAGLYPNPTLIWEADDVGDPKNAAGTQGPIFTQEIVTAHKLKLAQAAAAQGISVAHWQAVTRWFEVATRLRLAWYEALTAQEELRVHEEIVEIAGTGLEAAQKLQKAGAGTQPDVLRAQVDLEQGKLQLAVARQRLDAARRLLATAAGLLCLPPGSLSGTLHSDPPGYAWELLLVGVKTRSSEVQEALASIQQTEAFLQKAQADRCPNFLLSVRPFYHFPDQNAQIKIEAGMALPIFNRNQGNIYSAQADVVRARHELEQVELRLVERLALAFQRYRSAREQREAYQERIVPNATESLRLIRLGYERGDPKYDFTALLQAQRTLVQARLAAVRAGGELWRASSEIMGLLQEEGK